MKYGCESWTLNKDLTRRINAFEMWCYRRILKTKWTELIPNNVVLKRMKVDNPLLYSNIIKQKLNFAGHILRGSSDQSALLILEGKLNGINTQGRPRRMWIDDIKDWMKLASYEQVKRSAEDRKKWRNCTFEACQPSAIEDDN